MKQTAVEWLERRYDWTKGQLIQFDFDRAKEMDEQRQLDLIRFLRTQDKMGKSIEDLYEQFKSEQNDNIY